MCWHGSFYVFASCNLVHNTISDGIPWRFYRLCLVRLVSLVFLVFLVYSVCLVCLVE
jgi:hypothetical protein